MAFFPPITNASRIKKSQFVAPSLDGERSQLFLTIILLFYRYIEGLQAESKYISNWDAHLKATPETTVVPDPQRLPTHWLGNSYENHGSALNALWALQVKLPVQLINTTNEWRLVQGHETTPLRVKGDIEDVSSELDNGVKACTSWMKRTEFYCSQPVRHLIKPVEDL
ncbi:protein polybromo-1 [Trichonephila clavipes]|nr:protein polybromo-1 [Trichonephila clavipes]